MQFRLLGLLEVEADGKPVRIVSGRESALLALLLLHANQPLSTERIVDELWGEERTANAAKSVHIYVSRLRKALGADRIETTKAGYRIRVAPNELDSDRFAQLATEGRRDEALALWRGEPLADFRFEPFAQNEIRRLDALHDEVWLDQLDALLADGRAAQVIPDLEALIGRQPLWERPRGQLMRCLYLAGRQADALALYRSTRSLLDEELGVEPGPELQRLEQAILNQDPELGVPSRAAPTGPGRHRFRLVLAGVLLICLAVAAIAGVELSRSAKPTTLAYVPDSLARFDPAGDRIDAVLPLAGVPGPIAFARGSAWVASANRTISAVSLDTLRANLLVTSGFSAGQLVESGGRLWAVSVSGDELARIDPAYGTVRRPIRLTVAAGDALTNTRAAAASDGSVWITSGTRLVRYDRDGRKTATIDLHRPLTDIAAGLGRLWVLSSSTATLFERDQQTGAAVAAIPLEQHPGYDTPLPVAVTVGAGAVWVLDGSPPSVIRIDPRVGAVETTIPLGIGSDPTSIIATGNRVWVADSGDGTVARIDASTNALRRLVVGGSPNTVAATDGRVWVSVQAGLDANDGGIPAPLATGTAATLGLPSSICSPVYAEGTPKVIIAGDLPLQGFGASSLTLQLSNAIRYELALHHFRAGSLPVGYQLCDDSSAQTGSWTRPTCKADARAIAANKNVVGVIGPFNSGCAIVELPILAHARAGPVPVISPSATYVGLTHGGPGSATGEPAAYRANGHPVFMRVVASDDKQGAANALLARQLGVRHLYLLEDESAYGRGLASAVDLTARKLGITIAGRSAWPHNTHTYRALAQHVAKTHPDGVFLAGTIDEGGGPLIQKLRHALDPQAHILLSDGFTPFPVLTGIGPAVEGATITVPGPALSNLSKNGHAFATAFTKATGQEPQPYSVAAAEATEAMLTALANSNGTRSTLRHNLLHTNNFNGLFGNFHFNPNGDTTNSIITVYTVHNGQVQPFTTITPD